METITTSIPENVPDGSLVYDFEERFPVRFGRLFFFFDSPDVERVFYSHFTRDMLTNVITTSGNDFDRDEIAEELGNYVAPVVFNITVPSYDIEPMLQIIECIQLVINVIDADDEVPQFTTASLMIEFRDDDEELRQFKTLPLAPDRDEGDNGTRVYYLEDSIDQTFELEILKDENTQEIEDVLLRNIKPLNREERDMYFLTLVASEGKDDPDRATLPIVVKINDTCDEDPDFGTSGYSPLIAEDTRIGHTIMQLHAEDLDLGMYGMVTYHIKTVCTQKVVGDTCITLPEAEQLFDLDMETGNLVLQQELDREEQAQYDIVVEAVDGCGLSSTATVAIQVQDINDNEPTIGYNGVDQILENQPFAFLGLISVTDPDLGVNGTVVVELFDNSTEHLIVPENFRIVQDMTPNQYRFELIKELNRELVDGYSLVIVARDSGTPALSSTYPLPINVLDKNDHRPVFEPFQDMIMVKENETVGTQVLHLKANDEDVGADNSNVTYELPANSVEYPHQDLFRMEATTGRLLIAKSLDREEHAALPVLVLARDNPLQGGDSPLNSTVVVNVVLEDVNDNPPVIHFPTETLTILESQKPPFTLVTVNATDRDSTEQHSTLTYDLTGSAAFSIDSQGNINLVSAVDFDSAQPNHEVTITVSDGERTIQQSITIAVQNVNDEQPTFISGGYETTVIEEEPSGTSVVQVVAMDTDPPPHNFEYSINDGNQEQHFQIDPSTGLITTTVPLDREMIAEYTLFVAVSDGAQSSDGLARVFICVGDRNDHTPMLIGPLIFRVPERVPSRRIGTLEVDDPDAGDNARVLFKIIGGNVNDSFTIGNESGEITVTKSLDREAIALNLTTMQSEIILNIEIRDSGSPPHIVTSNPVTVVVEDENDNGPVFQQRAVTFRVPENELIGNVVGQVQAVDIDLPPNDETEYSIDGTPEVLSIFNIALDTGKLRLNRMLDYESTTDYQFIVFARDPDRADLFDTIMVNITVEDTFDPVIEFVQFNPFISLAENNQNDLDIITLEVIDIITNNPVPRLQFSLTNEDLSESTLFGIVKEPELSTATIHTLATINREDLATPEIRLNVTAHDTDPPSPDESYGLISATLTITILDVNDETPMFEAGSYQFDIDENRGVNEPLNGPTVTATDLDAGENGSVSYSVRPSSLPFAFNSAGELTATEPLDRELTPMYEFTVVASDGGTPPRTAEVEVTVAINDVNDNSPVFTPSQGYHFNISENTRPGTIATLNITDADEGENARIELRVAAGTSVDDHFFINPSGSIGLVSLLDRETQSFYSFEVEARDYGSPGRTTRATINVTVLDFNDHCPEFVNFVPAVGLPENFPTTETIASVSARDNDGGSNANILYAIGNVSLSQTFCIGEESGRLYLCEQNFQDFEEGMWPPEVLDYERVTEYDVEIIAFDQGSPRCVRSKILTVSVDNVNEHFPRFDRSMPLEVYVDEGQEAGTLVATIRAYDLDNDELSYSITEQIPQAHFRWDAQRGAIVTTRELDYEDGFRYYMLTLSVTEVGVVPVNAVSIVVAVFVHNVNDHSPAFESSPSSVVILESESVGTTVLTVSATDRDNVTNSAVLYSIASGNDGGVFSIDSKSGRISVASDLDYDSQVSYVLGVTAADTGPEPRTSEPLQITISLINENDERPIFSQPEYAFSLSENSEAGVIGVLNATDRDVGSFGTVRYTVTAGSNDYITVDEMTGVVSSVAPIDREALASNVIAFTVTASDLGQPSQSAVVPVTVTIVDVNDNTPLFSRNEFLVSLSNDLEVDTTFERVEVRDLDEGSNAEFSLEIVSIPTAISVEVTPAGDLVLKQALPQNYQPVYELTLRAVDSQDDSRTSQAVVKLIVESETDHHPWFDEQTYDIDVSENLGLGDSIFDFTQHVTDQDSGSLSYAIEPEAGQFLLDLENGRIVLREELDFESTETYQLSLFATDDTSRTATATLIVHITDYNDERPLFINPPSTITLSLVDTRDIELFTVRAEDSDTGIEDNSRVGYSIIDNTDDTFFAIDDVTGVVTNTAPLVREMTYSFVIRAFDYGTPLMSSNITVIVTVQDPATDAPRVSVGSIPFHLSLSEALSTPAVVYSSFEPETETPVADSYHIVYQNSSKGLFTIDETDGVLRLQSSLNFETESQYRLVVEARRVNPESGARYSTYVRVDITVEDENDNRPVFESIGTQMVSESEQPRLQLFAVSATDLDSGSLGTVEYTIIGGNVGQKFGIDRDSGEVTLEQTLDRELLSSYQLEIRASDKALSPQTAEITVQIEVMDVNDEMPVFESNYSIGVYESPVTVPGDRVILVAATDQDIRPALFYELTIIKASFRTSSRPISEHVHAFEIDYDTGEVRVGPGYQLDREEIDCFQMAIIASDTVNTVMTYLTITVLDVNEFAPVVTVPSELRKLELLPEGSLVTNQIRATDGDTGINAAVLYRLGDEWPEEFTIDELSGVIRIKDPIAVDLISQGFTGAVLAVDQGVPPLTGTAMITVEIRDVNDHPPLFDQPSYEIPVSINQPLHQVFYTFNVTDYKDIGFNSARTIKLPVYYEAFTYFNVDPEGAMSLKRDRSTGLEAREYVFRLQAVNSAPSPYAPYYVLGTSVDVTVRVFPENTAAPVFSQEVYTTMIAESLPPTTRLDLNISASDGDGDAIHYSIHSAMILPFEIDATTGVIRLMSGAQPDSEQTSFYSFTIRATDTGFPTLTASALVEVTVIDVNEHPPEFSQNSYGGTVAENSEIDTPVLTISATDPDHSDRPVGFEIIPPEGEENFPFRIAQSGVISTTAVIDADTLENPSYIFSVVASDGERPPLEATTTVTINVTGVNEFEPQFVVKTYNFTVDSDLRMNAVVGRVRATDLDRGSGGVLHYRFTDDARNDEPKQYFRIVETTGEIILIVDPLVLAEPNRKRAVTEQFRTFQTFVEVTDEETSDIAEVFLNLHMVFITEPGGTSPSAAVPFEIIAAVVAVVVIAIFVFVAILLAALYIRMRRRSKIRDLHPKNEVELAERYSRRSGSTTPSQSQNRQTAVYHQQGTINATLSGSDADDEESMNGEPAAIGYPSQSPGLLRKSPVRPSPRTRSASSLVNDSSQETAPYSKAQIEAIYAANQGLLNDDGSQESIHSFNTEGGQEADGDVDIDNILLSRKYELEDDEDSTTIMEDDASYMKDIQSNGSDSTGNLDIPPVEVRDEPFQFSQEGMRDWIPHPHAMTITDTIEELATNASYDHSQRGRPMYRGEFEPSQPTSLYGASTQGSRVSLLRMQQKHFDSDHQLRGQVPADYYYTESPPDSRPHPRHLPRSHHYGSENALMEHRQRQEYVPPDHLSSRHMYSQDLHPYHRSGHYISGRPLTPPSSTPTDGTVTPQRALNPDYDMQHYLSSSSTSLASTNLSQPIGHGRISSINPSYR